LKKKKKKAAYRAASGKSEKMWNRLDQRDEAGDRIGKGEYGWAGSGSRRESSRSGQEPINGGRVRARQGQARGLRNQDVEGVKTEGPNFHSPSVSKLFAKSNEVNDHTDPLFRVANWQYQHTELVWITWL
jgi:hypothetical protein